MKEESISLKDLLEKAKKLGGNGNSRGGLISIVNSENGKRLTINKNAVEQLENPEEIHLAIFDGELIICNSTNSELDGQAVKISGGKIIIYRAELIDDLVEQFKLDYSNTTSKSFSQGRKITVDAMPALAIKIE